MSDGDVDDHLEVVAAPGPVDHVELRRVRETLARAARAAADAHAPIVPSTRRSPERDVRGRARRDLDHDLRASSAGRSATGEVTGDVDHRQLAVAEDRIDRKPHEEHVDRACGAEQDALAGSSDARPSSPFMRARGLAATTHRVADDACRPPFSESQSGFAHRLYPVRSDFRRAGSNYPPSGVSPLRNSSYNARHNIGEAARHESQGVLPVSATRSTLEHRPTLRPTAEMQLRDWSTSSHRSSVVKTARR